MKLEMMMAAALASACVFADKVTLKSGSYLTGEAGVIQDGVLQFKSDDLGDVKIKIDSIAQLDSARQHVVQYLDNSREDKILTVKDGTLCDGNGKLDMSKVKATDPNEETWHGSVNVAYQAQRGNTFENSVSVIANLNRRWEKDRLAIDFGYFYSEEGKSSSDKSKTTDRIEAEVKHDHFWREKVYSYEDLRYDRDMLQQLTGRYRLGLGGGYQWLDNRVFESTGKWNFNQEVGVNWIKEEYRGPSDAKKEGFAALRYAHHLGYLPKWTEGLELFHNFEYIPEVDDWEKYLIKADVGFTTKIIKNIDLLAKIEWDYNSKPGDDRKKSDYRYIVGLGYKW